MKRHISKPTNKSVAKRLGKINHRLVLLDGVYSTFTAGDAEKAAIADYEKRGLKVLNRASAEALGTGVRKWTDEMLRDEALKYETRGEFAKASRNAYYRAQRRGILDDICEHMRGAYKPRGYWTILVSHNFSPPKSLDSLGQKQHEFSRATHVCRLRWPKENSC